MRTQRPILIIILLCFVLPAPAQYVVQRTRRQIISSELRQHSHSMLLVHAKTQIDEPEDGLRQDPFFYYFSGIENLVGAVLAIDCDTAESWLFLPTVPPRSDFGFRSEIQPGSEAEKRFGIEHVVDWSEMKEFFSSRSSHPSTLYFADGFRTDLQLPGDLLDQKPFDVPIWMQVITHQWPAFKPENVTFQVWAMMSVSSSDELAELRGAAKATVAALMAGLGAIRPGETQRIVESAVDSACWRAGAHGSAFWPWAIAGQSAVFPTPFSSALRYDHLDQTLRYGDLLRLDVGCEVHHYGGDLGRTAPVSGHFAPDQRETWEIYVAAYRAGAGKLRSGATPDQVFDAWRNEIIRHRASAKSELARHAIALWIDRKNVPYWQIHTTNLMAGTLPDVLLEGSVVNFEPMAAVDGQAFFTEDMYLITKEGAELLTQGVPTTADEIEAAMKEAARPGNRHP